MKPCYEIVLSDTEEVFELISDVCLVKGDILEFDSKSYEIVERRMQLHSEYKKGEVYLSHSDIMLTLRLCDQP